MATQDIQAIRAGYEDLSRDDFESWSRLIRPDVELPELPGAAVYRGLDGARRWFESARELVDEWRWSLETFARDRNPYVARVRLTVIGRESSVPIEQIVLHVFEMREGRAAVIRGFLDEAQALECAEAAAQ
jgi:ketosteroid isomerase-like protein